MENGPDSKTLEELVRGTVEAVHPRRITLFGSTARSRMGPHNDLDVLVVMPDGCGRAETAGTLYRAYRGLGCAHDIVVWEADVEKYGHDPYLIIQTALQKGRELYRDVV